jgi:predicted RNA binding protein YcfA (HicA-like mRNA interferase family)
MCHKGEFHKKLVRLFEEAGWEFARHGRHLIYQHPRTGQTATLPNKLNDRHLFQKLARLATDPGKISGRPAPQIAISASRVVVAA